MFEQAQANQTDLFGFGQLFRQQLSYQELKSWRELLSSIEGGFSGTCRCGLDEGHREKGRNVACTTFLPLFIYFV